MNMTEFKAKYPDLYQAIFDEGKTVGHATGLAEGEASGLEKGMIKVQDEVQEESAKAERERIQSVEAQSMPGHEALIQDLKFDGKTSGEQAAVQILQAEKALRVNMQAQLDADGIDSVAHVPSSEVKPKTMARAEFNKFTPADQAAYIKAGFKVVDK